MDDSDPHGLGYRDVDNDPHSAVLVDNMDATARWEATRRLRRWERRHLQLVAGERLLDVGCGLGEAGASLARDLGSTGELVGIDASAAMIAVARQRTRAAACSVQFQVGDARSLVLAGRSFDAVRSERTLQWLPEPEAVIAGFARVLRHEGRLSLIDTDWSTLQLEIGDPAIGNIVREALRVERNRPSK